MAASNILSAGLTARNAGNTNMSYFYEANLKVKSATLEMTSGEEANSVYRFVSIKSGSRLDKLEIACDAMSGLTGVDIGLYRTAADGGAVVDQDLIATAVDLSSALPFTEKTFEATATNISKCEKRIWELVSGLTADPIVEYDICLTALQAPPSGTVSMRVYIAT
jgi:hypothetical protein